MLSLRAHAWIAGGLFAAIIAFAIIGNVLHDAGLLRDGSVAQRIAMIVFFALFLGFGYSAIPLMVKLVLHGQGAIGNADVALVRAAIRRERTIVFAFWGLITLGLLAAIPAAIMGGVFDIAPKRPRVVEKPSEGILVAAPGMTVAEIRQRSTLKVTDLSSRGRVFDFTVPGTKLSFPRARAYIIDARSDRVVRVAVGTAQNALSRGELEGEDALLREIFAADGWLTGYDNYRTEQDKRFHGGLPGGKGGVVWLKGDLVAMIRAQRLDEPKAGESDAAGQWQQVIELTRRADFSDFGKYEFSKPQ
ncbi:MAG: hypothetical protein JO254_05720 [Pseudolabrys sp.]|nr:hypothetical protein [Pseudolabrys sp.]